MPCQFSGALEQQSDRFRQWAETNYPVEERWGEWECEYPEWESLYGAVQVFLDARLPDTWTTAEMDTLLYALARDSECGIIANYIGERPVALLTLARACLDRAEADAKWQIAVKLGYLPDHPAAEPLLIRLEGDNAEYVRRRALQALGCLKSSRVEMLVDAAWDTEDSMQEYQRMTVLQVLQQIGSPRLAEFLARVEEDGRPYLGEYALEIRSGALF